MQASVGLVVGGQGSTGAVTVRDHATLQTTGNSIMYFGYGGSGSLLLENGLVKSGGLYQLVHSLQVME